MLDSVKEKDVVILIVLFLLNPIAGILFATYGVLRQSRSNVRNRYLTCLFFMLAIYMGLLNATKVPASDQINYMYAYKYIPDQTIWQSLTNVYGDRYHETERVKEVGYGLLNVVGYVTSFGYYPLFILEFTVVLYLICFYAIRRLFENIRHSYCMPMTVAAVYIMCFFSQFFNLTVHLQRQEIAIAVMMYCIVDYCISKDYSWKKLLFPLFAVSLHTSVGLFLPLFFLRWIYKDGIGKKELTIILGAVILVIGSIVFIAKSLLGSIWGNSYALERLANAGSSLEDSFSFSFILMFTLPILFIVVKNILEAKKYNNGTAENLFYVFYVTLAVFYLFTPDTTMQYRFFMMSYSFWPFMIPLLFRRKTWISSLTLFSISALLFLRFFITFDSLAWKYTSVDNALFCNAISLFMKNPF